MFLHLSVILFTGGVCLWVYGVYTPWADTPPWVDIPLKQTSPWTDMPPPPMANEAGGIHPTGMHSCCTVIFALFYRKYPIVLIGLDHSIISNGKCRQRRPCVLNYNTRWGFFILQHRDATSRLIGQFD